MMVSATSRRGRGEDPQALWQRLIDAGFPIFQRRGLPAKDRDGVVLPLDILVTLLACCGAPEPDRSDLVRYAELVRRRLEDLK
jgi:hypothetical protein